MKDFSKTYQLKGLKPKNKGYTNFYECCDLTKSVYLKDTVYQNLKKGGKLVGWIHLDIYYLWFLFGWSDHVDFRVSVLIFFLLFSIFRSICKVGRRIWFHISKINLPKYLVYCCKCVYLYVYTLQKKDVWDQLFCPANCFKICHIYRKRKPM